MYLRRESSFLPVIVMSISPDKTHKFETKPPIPDSVRVGGFLSFLIVLEDGKTLDF